MSALTRDLHAYLMSHMYSVDHNLRLQGYWVMSWPWWTEICRMASSDTLIAPQSCAEARLFGLPVVFSRDGGIPHLAGPGIPLPGEWRPVRRYM